MDQCDPENLKYLRAMEWRKRMSKHDNYHRHGIVTQYGTKEELAELDHRFSNHAPHGDQAKRYAVLNEAAKKYGRALLENCPPSSEKEEAMWLLSLTRMMGNMSIAINESERSEEGALPQRVLDSDPISDQDG